MRNMSAIFAAAALMALGGLVQPAAAQTNQDYSTLPGYSAHPPGMCWHREFPSGHEDNGYWAACSNASQTQPANSARAQAQTQTSLRNR